MPRQKSVDLLAKYLTKIISIVVLCMCAFSLKAQKSTVIILKMDDLEYKSADFAQKWQRYVDTVRSYNIRSGLGVILDHISESPQLFKDSLSSWHASSIFEIWHHGWDHRRLNLPPDSANEGEFSGTSYAYQKAHLENGIATARQELGIELFSFGAPYNKTDETFTRVLSESESIKVWIYCNDRSFPGLCLVRGRSNKLESSTGVVSFSSFLNGYNANTNPYLILQGHPGKWDDRSFQEFEKVIDFLKKRGHRFVLPYEYYLENRKK